MKKIFKVLISVSAFFIFTHQNAISFPSKQTESVKILFRFYIDKDDNQAHIFTNQLKNSLKTSLSKSLLDSVHFQIMDLGEVENFKQTSHTVLDSVSFDSTKFNELSIIVFGPINKKEQDDFVFTPYILFNNFDQFQKKYLFESNPVLEKICHFKSIQFAEIKRSNSKILAQFLLGYLSYVENKNEKALFAWQDTDTFAGLFYRGNSYLSLGSIPDQTISIKKSKIDSAILCYKKGLTKAFTHADSSYIFNNVSLAFQNMAQPDSSLHYALLAHRNIMQINDPFNRMKIISNLGNCYLFTGKWNLALTTFNDAIENIELLNDTLSRAKIFENLGYIYQIIFQKNKAIECYEHALALRKSLNDRQGRSQTIRALGDVYLQKKEYDRAKHYFTEGLMINNRMKNEPGIALFSDRMGQVFHYLNQVDSATFYFQKSSDIFQLIDNKLAFVRTLIHRAALFQDIQKFDKAVAIYEHSLTLTHELDHVSLAAQIYDRLGDIYNTQNKLQLALEYYRKSADLYNKTDSFENLSLVLYNMGLIRLKQNNYADGYHLLNQAVKIDETYGFGNLKGEHNFIRKVKNLLNK